MSFSIKGKNVIVTGAANGIGLAIARQFADKGANVMCADTDEKALAEELGDAKDEGNIRFFAGDLRQRLTIANLVSATIDAFDEVDVLVNASRQFLPTEALNGEDTSVETLWQENVMTALQLTQQVSKRMIKQSEDRPDGPVGSIINLSSIASRHTRPELMAYSMAAAALEQMTRSMALALAPHRIRVNAVAFGSVMSGSLKASVAENREWRDDIRSHTPLGRIASPSELTDTIQYLAADSSSFMTGGVIVVDGGRSLLDAADAPAH
ncbi:MULTISPECIES: SDR family NAD(P)-dependent oxidoreductase [unclassified Sulfitobacter]|jgi:7-alpha-hydroxysteroid dehydrogenase|uniref:SDR family NAD(P)-dependent oxidoreductase n=1 Tax=unclassified Sulfitobacter TaxID=196795 RepID=UPI0015932E56|nr:SDR family oxidoreductase [Sulfitobacter sp. HGT1]MBQ0803949.1 SDR family oxidoreductase [Sulfitobacter sp.]